MKSLILFTTILLLNSYNAAWAIEENTSSEKTPPQPVDSSAPAPANTTPQIVENIPAERGASSWGAMVGIRTTKSSKPESANQVANQSKNRINHEYGNDIAVSIFRRIPLVKDKVSFQPTLSWTNFSMEEKVGGGSLEFNAGYVFLSPQIHLSKFMNLFELPIFILAGPSIGIKTNSNVSGESLSGQDLDFGSSIPFNQFITSAQVGAGFEFPIKNKTYLKKFILQTTYHIQLSSLTKSEQKTWEPKSLLFQIGTVAQF